MPKFTPEQKRVVEHDRGNILVSASAGSGKTHTMIERTCRLILDKKAAVNEILAVTFTEAAAAQMREKLRSKLSEKITNDGQTEFIEQLNLIATSDISTLHAFCGRLIRNYFFEVGLTPDFKIADESEAQILKNESIDRTFSEFYDLEEEWFLTLVERHAHGRKDKSLRELIISAYNFCQTEPNPDEVLSRYKEFYSDQGYSALLERYKTSVFEKIENLNIKAEQAAEVFKEEELDKSAALSDSFINHLQKILDEDCLLALSTIGEFTKRMDFDRGLSENATIAKAKILSCKTVLKKMVERFNPRFLDEDGKERAKLLEHTDYLKKVINRFGEIYSEMKREENVLDFNDLEHFALKILSNPEISADVKSKYKYVFVDEYQDTNGVQEEILNRVSNDNLLMVGDVKQSIYGFRGCRPDIFIQKNKDMSASGQAVVKLNENFRSANAVIDTVNAIFNHCMTEEYFGESYKGNSELKSGGQYAQDAVGRAELHFIEKPEKKKTEEEQPRVYDVINASKQEKETETSLTAALVTEIIKQELGKEYYDPKEKRFKNIDYSDVAILTRSRENKYVTDLVKGLRGRGITVVSEVKENVCDFPEISILVAALKLIDCFYQDIPLVTVLKSPIGGFTDEDLMEIAGYYLDQTGDKRSGFSEAFKYYIDNAVNGLSQNLKRFLDYFERIRLVADFAGAFGAIDRLVKEKDLESHLLAMTGGEVRALRLKRFLSAAVVGQKRLTVKEFLLKIETSSEAFGFSECGQDRSVKAMTIHKSKGLEFPVVIVCGLERGFNVMDERGEVLFSREMGLAVKSYDDDKKELDETLLRVVVQDQMRKSMVREEMRLFYVATTRATYSMHLIAENEDSRQDHFSGAECFMDFVPSDMEMTIHNQKDFDFTNLTHETRKVLIANPDKTAFEKMRQNFAFSYPYLAETTLPLKTDVTSVNKREQVEEEQKTFVLFDEETTDIERGNTAHKIMEHLDFSNPDFIGQVKGMIDSGIVSAEQVEKISLEKIENAVKCKALSGLNSKSLYREKGFLVGIEANKLFDTTSQETVVLQGIIDLMVVDGDSLRVIDYKYSQRVKDSLKSKYKKQLELYSYAAEKVLGKKVVSKTIVNLFTGESVDL